MVLKVHRLYSLLLIFSLLLSYFRRPSKVVHRALHEVSRNIERELTLKSQTNEISQKSPTGDVTSEVERSPYPCLSDKDR